MNPSGFQEPPAGWSLRTIPPAVYLFFAVFVLRLIVLARLTDSPFLLPAQGDMHFYNEWAQRVARGEWTDGRAFYGLPLYAYLLAGLYSIFGLNPFMPGVLQAALDAGTAALLFKLGERVFRSEDADSVAAPEKAGPRRRHVAPGFIIGLLAALAWAFYLPAQSFSVILMPTAWLVFVFWFVVWQVVRRSEFPPWRWFFLIGLCIGVTAMGVATILFLLPLVLAALAVKWSSAANGGGFVRSAMAALLVTAGVGLGTSPAWLHNALVARDPVFLSAHSGVNLWIGNNPGANGYPRFPPGLRAGQQAMLQDSITGAEAAAGKPLPRSQVSAFWSAKAKAYIAENPTAWLKLLGVKVANFWNAFQYDDISIITSLRENGVTFPSIRFGIVAALALAGIALAVAEFPPSRWILAAILLHMASLLSVFITERYRLAAVPGLLLFAAFAVWRLWDAVIASRYKRVSVCVLLLLLSSILVSARRGDAELWALDAYNSGLQAFESNKLDVAERKLRLAYGYVPDNAELNFALGNLHFARSERDEAERFYRRTLELDRRHEGAWNNLGVLALDQQRWELAINFLNEALRASPKDPKTHYLLARAHHGMGNNGEARRLIEIALQLRPEQPEFIELAQTLRSPQ